MAEEIPENLEIADELIAERRISEPQDLPSDMAPGTKTGLICGIAVGLLSGIFLSLVLESSSLGKTMGWVVGMASCLIAGVLFGFLIGSYKARALCYWIDTMNLWVGRIVCWMAVPMMLSIVIEVVCRTPIEWLGKPAQPTVWVYDVSRFLYGGMFMLGAGYALSRGVHIRADFIYRNWTARTQGTVDAVLYVIFYLPGLLAFFYISMEFAGEALFRGERGMDTAWMPYLWPIKSALPLGVFFLILQGVSELIKSLYAAQRGEWP